MRRLLAGLNKLIKNYRALKHWKRIVTVLAAIITFATTYALILPAITVEKDRTEAVAGMYLEKENESEEMLEENASDPKDVRIAASKKNAEGGTYADGDVMAAAWPAAEVPDDDGMQEENTSFDTADNEKKETAQADPVKTDEEETAKADPVKTDEEETAQADPVKNDEQEAEKEDPARTDSDEDAPSVTAIGDAFRGSLKKEARSGSGVTGPMRSAVSESTDLQDFLIRVAVSGASVVDGNYVVEEGRQYAVTMTFKESPQVQFDNRSTLIYQMPEGITLPDDISTSIEIAIVSKGKTYEIPATVTADEYGHILVNFDSTDPNFTYLEDATNVGFRVTVNAQFSRDISKTDWSAAAERDIILDGTDRSDAFVTKIGVFDEQTGRFTFTVKVTAVGSPENVNVKDLISGNALIFNKDVMVSGHSGEYTANLTDNGFDYTFLTMQDGEEITITYTASINPENVVDGTITADQTKNTVTVEREGGDPHTAEYTHAIDLVNLDKSDGEAAGEGPDGSKLYNWRIDYNEMALVSAAGDIITDTIAPGSQLYMTYYGDVTVNVLDSQGELIRSDTVTPVDFSWKYVVPATDTSACHYVFEYQTKVDQAAVDLTGQTLPLINTVTAGGKTDTGTINVSPAEETVITKAVESSTSEEVTWVSHIHVPASGLSRAVVTDTLPFITTNQIGMPGYESLYDVYKDGTLEVDNLLPGESYSVESEEGKVVITFFKDSEKAQPGLQGYPGGHEITIRLTTIANEDWLNYGYEHPSSQKATHWNTIDINTALQAFASVTFAKPGLVKTGEDVTGAMENQHFLYTLVLSGVSESPIIVEDTFDTNLLEVATDLSNVWMYFKIWGGDQNSQSEGMASVNYSDTATGIRITANDVPLQENGEYYPYYKIQYFLKLKDGVNLEDLAIENGGKYDLTNMAEWGDHTAEYTFTTEYDFLDKELLVAATEENRHVKYRITYNPAKAELNGGQELVMTDTLNKWLSLDYSSIVITTDPAGQPVPYVISGDESGGTIARYTIPDYTKVVITYDAMVVGKGPVNYVNVVEANGTIETIDEEVTIDIAGEGQGATADLRIVKVDGYDASKKLAGVQFRLYSAEAPGTGERYDLSLDGSGVYEKIITTDENGLLTIDGTEMKIYFGVKYYLEELEAPEGYRNLGFNYMFTLVDDMDLVDYPHFVYFYNDSFQIKNMPLEGLTVEKHVVSPDESDYTKEFTFKVSILTEDQNVDTSVNQTYGDMTFVNGTAEFALKDGEQLSAWEMPEGTKFKVEETAEDGFRVSVTYGETTYERTSCTGETAADPVLVSFTNTKPGNPDGYVLPATGGPGTGFITTVGLFLIAGAGFLLLKRRKTV